MFVKVACPQCSQQVAVPHEAKGTQSRCPFCDTVFDVPRTITPQQAGLTAYVAPAKRTSPVGMFLVGAGISAVVLMAVLFFLVGAWFGGANVDPSAAGSGAVDDGSDEKTEDQRRIEELQQAWLARYKPEALKGDASSLDLELSHGPRREPVAELADLVEIVEPSIVRINTTSEVTGSGFVLSKNGLVITNYHVISGSTSAEVVFHDESRANVLGLRAVAIDKDLVILQITAHPDQLKPIRLCPELPRKGEKVAAFGAPLGLSFSMSEGIVSGIRDPLELIHTNLRYNVRWIQTTAPISPGNSGGPLVNMRGEAVGVNTAASQKHGQNMNFAISAEDVRLVMHDAEDTVIPLSEVKTE